MKICLINKIEYLKITWILFSFEELLLDGVGFEKAEDRRLADNLKLTRN